MSDQRYSAVFGTVVKDAQGRTWVDVPRRSACQSCGKSSGCSMSVLGGLAGGQATRLSVSGVNLAPGQHVELVCPTTGVLKAALLAYGLPLAGLVVGALVAVAFDFSQGAQVLCAGVGLGAGALALRWASRRGDLANLTLIEE